MDDKEEYAKIIISSTTAAINPKHDITHGDRWVCVKLDGQEYCLQYLPLIGMYIVVNTVPLMLTTSAAREVAALYISLVNALV